MPSHAESFLCTGYHLSVLTRNISFKLRTTLGSRLPHAHCINEETEAQRRQQGQASNPRSLAPESVAPEQPLLEAPPECMFMTTCHGGFQALPGC